jgi:hypothetical protein
MQALTGRQARRMSNHIISSYNALRRQERSRKDDLWFLVLFCLAISGLLLVGIILTICSGCALTKQTTATMKATQVTVEKWGKVAEAWTAAGTNVSARVATSTEHSKERWEWVKLYVLPVAAVWSAWAIRSGVRKVKNGKGKK